MILALKQSGKVGETMLSDRRRLILKMIIDEFIESANPVGSKTLINKYEIPYSSATVRNEMMVLEELGLLEKTHTSSGRVPSEEGYKFYIDNLIGSDTTTMRTLTSQDALNENYQLFEELVRICYQNNTSFDEKIREILKIISKITNYTVFYLGPSLDRTLVSRMRLVQISQFEALIILITDVGKIETKIITTQSLHDYILLENIIKYLNEILVGTPLSVLNETLANEIAPFLNQRLKNYDIYHKELHDFFSSFVGSATYFSGQVNMLPDEFDTSTSNFSQIKDIFNFFENERAMQWFKSEEVGIDVHIGEEIHHELFRDYAIVRLTFRMPNQGYGTIGIIGPKRMHYNDVIQLLSFVQQFIDKGGNF
jgi:heat-inducible transcriptional repressor